MTSRSDGVVPKRGRAAVPLTSTPATRDVERWAASLRAQFARIDPGFVHDGALRVLLSQRAGATALRLLPLLTLRGRGRPDAESFVALGETQAFCRVSTPDVVDLAVRASLRAGLLAPGSARDGGRVRFCLTRRVIAAPAERAVFYLAGALLASGVWASLSDNERAVLFAIGAGARGATFGEAGENWGYLDGDVDDDVFDWVVAHAAAQRVERPDGGTWERFAYYAHRCGPVSTSDIAVLTGLDQAAVQHAVARSLHRADGALLRAGPEGPEGTWYHLPEALWGPPSRPATTG